MIKELEANYSDFVSYAKCNGLDKLLNDMKVKYPELRLNRIVTVRWLEDRKHKLVIKGHAGELIIKWREFEICQCQLKML